MSVLSHHVEEVQSLLTLLKLLPTDDVGGAHCGVCLTGQGLAGLLDPHKALALGVEGCETVVG